MKNTLIINVEKNDSLETAAKILREGGTVAFPTETVYGVGANALSETAINEIYIAKGRPSDNPLIVHITSYEVLDTLVKDISEKAKKIMARFWPGPLTLIFNSKETVAANCTPGLSTLAVRMPSHPIARTLIEMAGVPVAAPSGNLSGKPSPTEGHHVVHDLNGRVDAIVMEKQSEFGLESTILDMTQEPPMVLRPGSITVEAIESLVGRISVDPALDKKLAHDIQPKAPGMKYTHYSPNAEVKIVSGDLDKVVLKISELVKSQDHKKVGVMCCDETKDQYNADVVLSLGSRNEMANIAANLFKTLRQFDTLGVDIVFSEGYDTLGMGKAIMNRLNKAAGYETMNV